MDFDSSDDETARQSSSSVAPSPKRRWELDTDVEDISSAASSDSDTDDPRPTTWDLAPRNARWAGPRRRGGAPRRQRALTGGARADDFVATVRLMSEVEALRRHRDELMSLHFARVLSTARRDAFINTTIEYYDTFRDGFSGPRVPEMIRFFNTRLDQEIFVYGGGGLGLDTWVEQWRRYTRMFPSISIRLTSVNTINLAESTSQPNADYDDPTVATCIIDTHGMLDGIITRQAVCTVFPHLRQREDMIQKLVGRPLNLPMNLRFYFNNTGRVIRYDFDGDYFQAFSNLEDVGVIELTEIMEHVAIGENSTVPAPVELGDEADASP